MTKIDLYLIVLPSKKMEEILLFNVHNDSYRYILSILIDLN